MGVRRFGDWDKARNALNSTLGARMALALRQATIRNALLLVREIQRGNQTGVPVVIFCIAYGSDADYDTLRAVADASGGQVREGTEQTIRELYKLLSSYF